MEGSKRTTVRIGHLSSSTKKQAKKKRYHLMTEICCPTIHQITLSSLWLQPAEMEQ